ncbi:hypothetical protein [Asticcacaulis sp. W401b]|uniref:hypothetical protein n=1 Tax=Asticcacaulis sp. W401b TaxID=3388666 RepID=UPI00397052D3
MSLTEFITLQEISQLPPDPHLAFAHFVQIVESSLERKMKELDDNSQSGWELMSDVRHSFMNHIIAAAKRYRIRPIMGIELPKHNDFDYQNWRQFKSDLDHYVTQILLNDPEVEIEKSVALTPEIKSNIRSYIVAMKGEVDRANLSDDLRDKMLKKLREFEDLLEERRISFLAVTGIIMTILGVPGSLYASYDIVTKLSANIFSEMGKAKAIEAESRAIAIAQYEPILIAPRSVDTGYIALEDAGCDNAVRVNSSSKTFDLDDEIPF